MGEERRLRVTVVVLGDVGRSPRMQYHAMTLAAALADVDVIGYEGTRPHPTIRDHEHIRWHLLPADTSRARHASSGARFVARAAAKVLTECARLLWLLLRVVRKPDVVL